MTHTTDASDSNSTAPLLAGTRVRYVGSIASHRGLVGVIEGSHGGPDGTVRYFVSLPKGDGETEMLSFVRSGSIEVLAGA